MGGQVGRHRVTWALLAAGGLCSCGPAGAPVLRTGASDAGTTGVLRGSRTDGSTTFVQRIDGDVRSIARADLVAGGPQWVVLTGLGSGLDQGSVIVLGEDGVERMRYRVCGDTPDGYRNLAPNADRVAPYDALDRRFMVVSTSGLHPPYGVEILEVTERDGLRPRFRFWDPGAINTPVVADGLIAFRCVNNTYRADGEHETYPVAVGVLALERVLGDDSTDRVGEGVAPSRDGHPGRGFERYFVFTDRAGPGRWSTLSVGIVDGIVRARTDAGLTYELHPSDGSVRALADASYRRRHERLATGPGTATPIDQHLARLARDVLVIAPDPD